MSANETALHRAARIEDAVHARIEKRLLSKGWVPSFKAYTGYGAPGWVRVFARLLLSRPDPDEARGRRQEEGPLRGWRSFTTTAVSDAEVVIDAGGRRHVVRTDRGGYIDATVASELEVGWGEVVLTADGAAAAKAPVRVVGPETTFGVVSDIDDTVLVTSLPRPMLAAWNTFVLDEHARAPVPGMAVLYERLVNAHPGSPVFYLSTGAWNVAPTLTRFLGRHLYPAGPLLLTDWGPTKDGWFRSGRAHKRAQLQRLAREMPQVKWLLIGDDGQHDPELYADFVDSHPDQVAGVAIRHLSPAEQVLASGLPVPADSGPRTSPVPWVSAPNGASLSHKLADVGLL